MKPRPHETLDPEWFAGPERVQRIFNETADDTDNLTTGSLLVYHTSSVHTTPGSPDTGSLPDAEHGWVMIQQRIWWDNYVETDENVSIGRAHTQALNESGELHVITPESWEPTTLNGDPVVRGTGHTRLRYVWWLSGDDPDLLLEFESPTEPRDDSQGFAGIPVTLVAILLAVGLMGLRRRLE
ncbi:hypothetical protein [Natrinema amylolyticum]|uniref:hypothetical protein n=1 Tax=Natrinema amylolyticum TaxID=2878679 RepID=UPI001CF99E01|nr:hypothetical protein [Natrinema amylolyticum]